MKDPRDGVSWAQKWRWLTAGGHDVGAEPTALLADYIHRTHNPGWLRVARAVEQSIPAVAVERTLRKIDRLLAQSYAVGEALGTRRPPFADWWWRDLVCQPPRSLG